MSKYTQKDIKELAAAIRRSKDDFKRPFVLLVGAGCSLSAGIPLAGTLVREIHERFGEECRRSLDEEQYNDYGACMGCLAKNERRDLLSPYLENAKVNWAHVAIATMLEKEYVSRVLTFNFDSILAKACGLVGLYPATYDFAAAPSVVTDYISDPAIIHLHGQGYGMSMLNTDKETKLHADNLIPLLRNVFTESPMLIVGYSGSSDAVFPTLVKQYSAQERLYWIGHSEEQEQHVNELLEKGGNTAQFIGGADADLFLVELARELNCFPPKLFKNPYRHLLDELGPLTDFPFENDKSQDILSNLREELNTAEEKRNKKIKPDIAELLMEGKWDAVIQYADRDNSEEREQLTWAYIMQGNSLLEQAELKNDIELYQESAEKYSQAIAIKSDDHEAFYNWGIALADLAKLKKDAELYQESFEKYAQAIAIKPDDHQTLNNWGVALMQLAGLKEDSTLYQESTEKYAQAIAIKPDDHQTLNNWGLALMALAELKSDSTYLVKAQEKFERAEKIDDKSVYNFACVFALLGNTDACKEKLLQCKKYKTLPDKAHILSDEDLDSVREEEWFKQLIADL